LKGAEVKRKEFEVWGVRSGRAHALERQDSLSSGKKGRLRLDNVTPGGQRKKRRVIETEGERPGLLRSDGSMYGE